jgi:translation initiation factor IF-2
MAQMSVEQFANELGLLPAVLLEQLKAAGVKKMLAEDSLTEQDKALLLDYLRKTHGTTETKSKVTLTRRQTSEIRKSDSTGRARTIQVEVRKRRVLTKPMMTGDADAIPAVADKSADATKQAAAGFTIDEDQLALRNEEARKQAELIARQAEEVRQKRARKSTEAADHAQKKTAKAEIVTETNPATINPQPSETAQPVTGTHLPITAKNNEIEQQDNIDSQSSPTGGTLHKPTVKAEEKTEKKAIILEL